LGVLHVVTSIIIRFVESDLTPFSDCNANVQKKFSASQKKSCTAKRRHYGNVAVSVFMSTRLRHILRFKNESRRCVRRSVRERGCCRREKPESAHRAHRLPRRWRLTAAETLCSRWRD